MRANNSLQWRISEPAEVVLNISQNWQVKLLIVIRCILDTDTSRLTRLIILQKRAVRIITKSDYKCHTAQLFLLHGILTLDQIRILQTGEFMFRYKHGLLPNTFTDYFKTGSATHSYSTRTASNYRPIFAHTNTRKFSIKITGPTVWNNLPADILSASHLLLFKKLLRAHLLTLNI